MPPPQTQKEECPAASRGMCVGSVPIKTNSLGLTSVYSELYWGLSCAGCRPVLIGGGAGGGCIRWIPPPLAWRTTTRGVRG